MQLNKQTAKHFRDVYFGGNWTVSSMKEVLKDVDWQQALTKAGDFNTIAVLVFHTNYFVGALLRVLKGEPINASDKLSFDHPPINSQQDWEKMVNKTFEEAEEAAKLIEQLPENKMGEIFVDDKYGNYYRNIHGIIEHTHYHLGQIALIKKLVVQKPIGT